MSTLAQAENAARSADMAAGSAVSAQDLSKAYRLYDKPIHRLYDLILPGKPRYREFWAVQGLNDDEPLPTDKESAVFYDMDGDTNPGATLTASGLVDGEVYVAQRKTVDQQGVVQGTDSSFGLAQVKKEGTVLGASNDLLLNEAPRTPHPNPKNSWWVEVRIDDGAGCDGVTAARDSEALPLRRPF